MVRYALRRGMQTIAVLFGVSVLVHIAMFVMPGDPIRPQFGVRVPDPEVLSAARAKWGLDDPWPVQYLRFLRNVVTGDFGSSYVGRPAADIVSSGWRITLRVALLALLIQVVVGVWIGVAAGRNPGGWLDRALNAGVTAVLSVPMMLFAVFASAAIPWFLYLPGGFRTPTSLKTVVLPAAVLALLSSAIVARLTRLALHEELREAYVKVAQAKGLGDAAVIRHALRNALVPVVTFVGADIAAMSSTLPVIEKAFYLHGLGASVVDAARANDTAPLIAIVAVFTLIGVTANLVADLAAAALDPRRRDVRSAAG